MVAAMCLLWAANGCRASFRVTRGMIMEISKIRSTSTYHKNIRELHSWGHIRYEPSYHPAKGSRILVGNHTGQIQAQPTQIDNRFFNSMSAKIITPEDLQAFKHELLEELAKLLIQRSERPMKKWLRSAEVRKMLHISTGTLQNLRVNGTLPFTKIGGIVFYDYEDIQKMLNGSDTDKT